MAKHLLFPAGLLGAAAAQPAAAQFVGDPAAPPAIRIAEAPPACCFGTWAGTLRGSVTNVETADVRVVLYAHTDLWYLQPYEDSRLAPDTEGRWSSPVRGGAVYAALLVRADWTPPATCVELQAVGGGVLARSDSQTGMRRLQFAARTWVVKSAVDVAAGPGPNFWGDGPESVWVDADGRLHLRLVEHDGRWYAAEVYAEESSGYGQYRFTIASRVDRLDANAVFAGFLYADGGAEMDVEWSRWGNATSAENAQFVVQPDRVQPLTLAVDAAGIEHEIDWRPGTVDFTTRSAAPSGQGPPLASWSVHDGVPAPEFTRWRFNLWLHDGAPPQGADEIEVVVAACDVATPTDAGVAARHGILRLAVATPMRGDALRWALEMPGAGRLAVELFDPRGRRVAALFTGECRAGVQHGEWGATRLVPGVYFLRARAAAQDATRKLVVLP